MQESKTPFFMVNIGVSAEILEEPVTIACFKFAVEENIGSLQSGPIFAPYP
jgi:hypothetical protein